MAYAQAEKAAATRVAYASDWRDFAAWCALRGATALPATPGLVAAHLSDLAGAGGKASTSAHKADAIRPSPRARRPRAANHHGGREGRAARHPPHHRHRARKAPATGSSAS